MKVLIADKFESSGVNGLKALGCEVTYDPELKDDALAKALASSGAAVLIVRSTKVTDAMMPPSLKLIVRAGAGVNTIDVKTAVARGIQVANCPGKNAIAVAELAFALILALDRRIPDNVAELRAGKWNKKEYSKARGLFGQTLGLLGFGPIGIEMARRAAAFGMPVVAWHFPFNGADRHMTAEEAEEFGLDHIRDDTAVAFAPTPADVAARCDILSVHLALVPATRNLVNANVLARLKPGSVVINAARGEIVDHDALRTAMREKNLKVGLDVYANEPATATGDFADTIVREPNVYGTHHIGASTDQAQEAIAAETVRIVDVFLKTGQAPNTVGQ